MSHLTKLLSGAHACFVDLLDIHRYSCIYIGCMSPALTGSSVVWCFEHSNAIEYVTARVLFHFYTGLSHIVFPTSLSRIPAYSPPPRATPTHTHTLTAEWQVMCIFKALHKDAEQQDAGLSCSEFYSFYEMIGFKWKQVELKLVTLDDCASRPIFRGDEPCSSTIQCFE